MGKQATFGEHVFYRFRDGHIDEVSSIFDILALQTSSAG